MVIRRLRALLFKSSKKRMLGAKAYAFVSAEEAAYDPYPYAFVNEDGTARELNAAEREYLERPFVPFDGGRPYVKNAFDARDGWGSIKGFLLRTKLPIGLLVAPPNTPHSPMSKADQIALMKEKAVQFGFEVIEKSDGTVEMIRSAKK